MVIALGVFLVGAGWMFIWDYVFGSSEFLAGIEVCTDIWQQTHNDTLYYRCMDPLNTVLEGGRE